MAPEPPPAAAGQGVVHWFCDSRRWVFSSSWRAQILPVGLPQYLAKVPGALFSLVFPDDCRLCRRPLEGISRIPVCAPCLDRLEPLAAEFFCVQCRTPFLNRYPLDHEGRCALCRSGARGFDAAYSYGPYEGALRELIHLLKYSRIRTLAGPLGERLSIALPRDEQFDAIVPTPLHWWRRWRRGFNQSHLLAKELSRRTGIPVLRAVRRIRDTASQAGLSHSARRRNVAAAFRARQSLEGRRVLLVDDVMTTGATASACARALKEAGARYVALLALARADRRSPVPARDAAAYSGVAP